MKFKNKRHIVIPVAIVIYTLAIAIYFGVKSYATDNQGYFFLVIGIHLVLAIVLCFILKKREEFRNNQKK